MDAVTYLREKLVKISKNFPNVHIKYGYNNIIRTHIVELLPVSEYQYNTALDDAWIPLSFEFREAFPKEEIAFVSSDSDLSLDKTLFELNCPSLENIISEVFASFSEKEFNYTFPTSIPNELIEVRRSFVGLLHLPTQPLLIQHEVEFDTCYQAAA